MRSIRLIDLLDLGAQMNHLRELIEEVNSNHLLFAPNVNGIDRNKAVIALPSTAEKAISFFAGEPSDFSLVHVTPELLKLPFPVTWVEMADPDTGMVFGALLTRDESIPEYAFQATAFARGKAHKWVLIGWGNAIYEGGKAMLYTSSGSDKAVGFIVKSAGKFLCAINCQNIQRQQNEPPNKLQKARTKRGKAPLFTYWTLQLKVKRQITQGAAHDGTQTSRRFHLCRGHIKQRKTGNFWWQPHARGSIDAGLVHKDYNASESLIAAARSNAVAQREP